MNIFEFMTESPLLSFCIALIIGLTVEVIFKSLVVIVKSKRGGD